jgi:hypothetical protein
MILAAAAAFLAAPAAALTPAATTAVRPAQGEVVEIPFAPPIGRTLRYRLVREATRAGRPNRSEVVLAILFRQASPDYVMSVRIELPPGLPPPSGATGLGELFNQPMEFRLSADGEILELLNIEAMWTATERALRESVAGERPDERAREAMEQIMGQMRALSPEAQRDLFAQNVAPVVAAAATTFTVGEEMSDRGRAESVVGSLEQSSSVRLDGADSRIARLSMRSSVSNEELEAGMRSMIGGLAPAGRPMPAFRIVSNEAIETYHVSRETGLTESYRIEKRVVTAVGAVEERGVQVQSLELIR